MAWEDIDVTGNVQEYRERKEMSRFVEARDWAYHLCLPVELMDLIEETSAPLEDLNSYFVAVFLYISVSTNGVRNVHAHPHAGAILKYAVERICNTFALVSPAGSKEYSADLDYALALVLATLFSVYPVNELQGGLSILDSLSAEVAMGKSRLAGLKNKFNVSANGSAQFASLVRICALNMRVKWVKAFPEVLDSPAVVASWVQEILTVRRFQGVLPYEECVAILECYFRRTGDFLFHGENAQTAQKYPSGVYYLQHDPPSLWNVMEPDFDALLRDQFGLPELNGRHRTARAAFVNRIRGQYEVYPMIDFHRISHYKDNAFYIDAGGNRVIKIKADRVSVILNGRDGIYFLPEMVAWTYVPEDKREVHGLNLLTDILVDPTGAYTQEQASCLLEMWIVSNFMRGMVTVRPLLSLLGEKGSGKTTLAENIVRLITGNEGYTSAGLPGDERSFAASVHSHGIVVYDNVEDGSYKWNFKDALARVYGSGAIESRELFTNASNFVIRPDVFVILTAIRAAWGRSDVADRSIVIQLTGWFSEHTRDHQQSSSVFIRTLMNHRNDMLSFVVDSLQRLLKYLENHSMSEHYIPERMESFASSIDAWAEANGRGSVESRKELWAALKKGKQELVVINDSIVWFMELFIRHVLSLDSSKHETLVDRRTDWDANIMVFRAESLHQLLAHQVQGLMSQYPTQQKLATDLGYSKDLLKEAGLVISSERVTGGIRVWRLDFTEWALRNLTQS